jgi:hypothetical protein
MTEFYIESVHFQPYPVQFRAFRQSRQQDIGKYLYKLGRRVQVLARADAPVDTGALKRSIYLSYDRGFVNPSVTIGSNLRYAYMVHEGTSPHVIDPANARIMRFVAGGRVIYVQRVYHPGTPANNFLERHLHTVVG